MQHYINFFLKFKCNLLVKRVFSLLNAAFAMTILDLTSRVRQAPLVILLHKIFEILHIFRLILIYHYLYCGRLPLYSYYRRFSHIHFYSTASSKSI